MRTLLVDTVPRDARNRGAINLGQEIVRECLGADLCHWSEQIDCDPYDLVGFNVFYPMHLLNVAPFLHRNQPRCRTVAGGQGLGTRGILGDLVDDLYTGELDGEENATEIVSAPVIRDGKGVIELTRGCRMRCGFCEYAWGREYREKPLELVKQQIDEMVRRRCRRINFMSANFAGYSRFDELMEYAAANALQILNSDHCISSAHRLYPWLVYLPRTIKCGIESFDAAKRAAIGKPISDARLLMTITELLKVANHLHFYLIYGLPGDDYDRWFAWLETLAALRETWTSREVNLFGEGYKRHHKNVRFELSITNFEPAPGTPFAGYPEVDFAAKAEFLAEWGAALVRLGFHQGTEVDYVNCGGRFGRKELSYRMLMALKKGGPELGAALREALPHGVGRSVSDAEAARFLAYV